MNVGSSGGGTAVRTGASAGRRARWLAPLVCRHQHGIRTSESGDGKLLSSDKFLKFWRTKLFRGGVCAVRRYFAKAGPSAVVEHEGALSGKEEGREWAVDRREDAPRSNRSSLVATRCQSADTSQLASVRCDHHHHIKLESCALYCQLSKHGWYWGGITSGEAEDLLAGQHDNVFLVRDSYHSRHLLCVSFRCVGRTLHTRLRHANGLFSLNNETFVPVSSISEHCAAVDVATILFDTPVRLARPLNRFAKLDTLQLLCRFVIRQSVHPEKLMNLPLPPALINYVTRGSLYCV